MLREILDKSYFMHTGQIVAWKGSIETQNLAIFNHWRQKYEQKEPEKYSPCKAKNARKQRKFGNFQTAPESSFVRIQQ